MKKTTILAFTLVELIVVITILAILGTIGFVSLQGYSVNARDSVRISDTKTFLKALNIYQTKNGEVPLPDDMTTITGSGVVFSYQGTLSGSVIAELGQGQVPVDPLLATPYLYATNNSQTRFQILSYMEKNTSVMNLGPIQTFAENSHAEYFPRVVGDGVGMFLHTDQSPLSGGDFDISTNTSELHYLNQDKVFTGSGYDFYAYVSTQSSLNQQKDCPENYIFVPGNIEFSTENGFCVAQYEMTYTDADTPLSEMTGWNTVSYDDTKLAVSLANKYPIADITQGEAIEACQALGSDYHLITNNEWMTIARNIEVTDSNWSSGISGQGYLHTGVSSETDSLGCDRVGGNQEIEGTSITRTGPGENETCNYRRQHVLSNGNIIWDLAGNAWEHVNKSNTYSGSGYSQGRTAVSGTQSTPWDSDGIYDLEDMRKYGSLYGYGSEAGMGSVYEPLGRDNNVFLRGSRGYQSSRVSGIYALHLAFTQNKTFSTVGFRCVYIH